jgi:TPR repeat protein
VAKDSSQAVSWWRKAAELGDADAQCIMGQSYANGLGVVQDYVQAVLWYRKAAEQGNVMAQYHLGVCYFNSAGVAQDNVHAVYWTRKAAEQGNETAQLSLGWCYYNGEGVAKDVVEAYAYFSLAGKAHALGSKHLGFIEAEISEAKIAAGKKRTIELQKEIEAKMAAKKAGK